MGAIPSSQSCDMLSSAQNYTVLSTMICLWTNSAYEKPDESRKSTCSTESTSTSASNSGGVNTNSDIWGWFEDIEQKLGKDVYNPCPFQRILSLPTPQSDIPNYIVESSIETQYLWYLTAGRRPKQPDGERESFERLCAEHLNVTNKDGTVNENNYLEGGGRIIHRGRGPFSISTSRTFLDNGCISITLQLPKFRVIEKNGQKLAEYLITISLGNNNSKFHSFGVWKRHSHFQLLMESIRKNGAEEVYKNTLLSWQCLVKRKRWFRSFDYDYLSLKCYLLERLMQDFLFETTDPTVLGDFLGLSRIHSVG